MQFNIYNNNYYFFYQSTGRGLTQRVGEKGDSTIGQIGRGLEKLEIQPTGIYFIISDLITIQIEYIYLILYYMY